MVKLGCKFECAKQSYCTDGHERDDVIEHRCHNTREKQRLALRQPHWIRVKRNSLSKEDKGPFVPLMREGDDKECPAEAFKFEQDGVEWLEFHVDFLGGGSNDKHDVLIRAELGPEGGSYSVRFNGARLSPCAYSHAPEVCRCHMAVYYIGQDESVYKA